MKRFLIASAMLFGAEGTAQACSCDWPTYSPAQLREAAESVAAEAVALVEVDVISSYDASTGQGEALRVRETLAGRAPHEFRIERSGRPAGSMCDTEFWEGTRRVALIFPAEQPAARSRGEFRSHHYCLSHWLFNDQHRQALIEAMRQPRAANEASGSPEGAPCANNA